MMTRTVFPLVLCLLAGLALGQDDCEDEENGQGDETTMLPTSGSEPERRPGDWNLGEFPEGWVEWSREQRSEWIRETEEGRAWFQSFLISRSNNCYNYACNQRNGPAEGGGVAPTAEMGRGGGATPPGGWCRITRDGREVPARADDPNRGICNADMTCARLGQLAAADGLVAHDCDAACNPGSYKKALVLNPLTDAERADVTNDVRQTDYHWYRQDQGGRWSHKPGEGQVQTGGLGLPDGSQAGSPIHDPREANARGGYTEFCACYCCGDDVRKASVDAHPALFALLEALVPSARAAEAVPALEDPATAPIEISRLMHSGRANPVTEIRDYDKVVWLMKALGRGEAVDNPCWQSEGLQGYAVHINRVDLVAESGVAPTVVVRDGLVQSLDQYRSADRGLVSWIDEQFRDSRKAQSDR